MGYFFILFDALHHLTGSFYIVPQLHSSLCAIVSIQKYLSNLKQII